MATKLKEHTTGCHIYMQIQLDDDRTEEISAYIREKGWSYRTSADHDPATRAEIIRAFNELY